MSIGKALTDITNPQRREHSCDTLNSYVADMYIECFFCTFVSSTPISKSSGKHAGILCIQLDCRCFCICGSTVAYSLA